MAQAAALLQAGVGDTALVWRQGFVPRLRALPVPEHTFTHAVCQSQSLAQALDAAAVDFDFSAWLRARVHDGFLLGAQLVHGGLSHGNTPLHARCEGWIGSFLGLQPFIYQHKQLLNL